MEEEDLREDRESRSHLVRQVGHEMRPHQDRLPSDDGPP